MTSGRIGICEGMDDEGKGKGEAELRDPGTLSGT